MEEIRVQNTHYKPSVEYWIVLYDQPWAWHLRDAIQIGKEALETREDWPEGKEAKYTPDLRQSGPSKLCFEAA